MMLLPVKNRRFPAYVLLAVAVCTQVALWIYARDIQARWTNVPPVPSSFGASGFGLGDTQFAYRSLGLMIQNLGDTGGRTTNFEEYDYTALGEWFRLMDTLDASANFIPFLAAYYFGSVETPGKAAVIVDYLAEQGRKAGSQEWRWLARASFLARFAEKNQDKALTLARELAAMYPKVQLPFWARQMPVFILEERGQKEAALAMVLETLKSESHTLPPQEVNALIDVICTRLLSKEEVQTFPLCEDYRNP